MLETFHGVVLVLATLGMGLFAGLFFGVVVAMMPGLGRTDAHVFVTGMQEINAAILNRWFFLVFLGGPLVTGVAMVLTVVVGAGSAVVALVVVAFALSVSALVTTVTVNVPLNNALAAAGPVDGIGDATVVRERFERPWVRWNVVRTVTSTAAFACLAVALVTYGAA